jgi:hypothetical protein
VAEPGQNLSVQGGQRRGDALHPQNGTCFSEFSNLEPSLTLTVDLRWKAVWAYVMLGRSPNVP